MDYATGIFQAPFSGAYEFHYQGNSVRLYNPCACLLKDGNPKFLNPLENHGFKLGSSNWSAGLKNIGLSSCGRHAAHYYSKS